MLAPSAATDTYATHSATYGRGGCHHVATIVDRNAIPSDRRMEGMLCTVAGDPKLYRLAADLIAWITIIDAEPGGAPLPLHGTTAQRMALSASFTPAQSGYSFYDTDLENLFFWNGDHWETSVIMGYGPRIAEYVGTPAQILPLHYRTADRWTNTSSPALTVSVCKAIFITHTLADWVPLGKQGG